MDYTLILVALISSITTLFGTYLKEYFFPQRKKQELTTHKSNCYIELDRICAVIKDAVKAQGVYIAYFHNGGHFINGVQMDKYTIVGEDYDINMTSYKKQHKDILVNNFPYLFHNLITRNRHYIKDVENNMFQDKYYKDELIARNVKSVYSFLISDPVKNTPIGFVSIEYTNQTEFDVNNEHYIWKRQNKIANLLNLKL